LDLLFELLRDVTKTPGKYVRVFGVRVVGVAVCKFFQEGVSMAVHLFSLFPGLNADLHLEKVLGKYVMNGSDTTVSKVRPWY
jgi:hypothetical protein